MIGVCSFCREEARLFEAVTAEGIQPVCRMCLRKYNWPMVNSRNMEDLDFKEETKDLKNAYYAQDFGKESTPINSFIPEKKKIDPEVKKINEDLIKIVEENSKTKNYSDLVDNFHWHIQQGRRNKKISQKQLAEAIAEPESIIALAEKGQLPQEYIKLIVKTEQFLGVKLRKNPEPPKYFSENQFDINKADLNEVKTSDLKKIQDSSFKEKLSKFSLGNILGRKKDSNNMPLETEDSEGSESEVKEDIEIIDEGSNKDAKTA